MSDLGVQPLTRRQAHRQSTRRKRRKRPPRPTFLGVVGELLITAGIFVLLFVVWELYWTNLGANRDAQAHRETISESFSEHYTGFDGNGADPAVPGVPGEAWGLLYVPRFGPDYSVPVLEGTGTEIDSAVLGRYENSPAPGEEGNLALAGHRQTYGAVLWDMDQLQEGDRLYLQTANGWWVYETRKVHIVQPSAVEVLDPNPLDPGGPADGQWLTLTTCHPPYTVLERMITHAEQVEFVPLAEGPPAEIADAVNVADFEPEPQAGIHTPEHNDAVIHHGLSEEA
ncbi:MAG TPA: class E sortase [Enteractinococcus helveticum]|uniref:Class E sortase n=1 Tax=Enteractinococcus helveticum TaxID=1837282 RepID=A0A921FLE3_9MICC|nr:class E sortase [Enteractinococcus helveticum]HJF13784.1 class E sortase [Enteractinococcus helveticum]